MGSVTEGIVGVVSDIDNTVYCRSPEYFAAGSRRELEGCASVLGLAFGKFEPMFKSKQGEIAARTGRKVTVTETVYELGVTPEQWSDLRCVAWQPEKWISSDREICQLLVELSQHFVLAFGTNSPIEIGKRTLQAIGIAEVVPQATVFGPEILGASKPNPAFHAGIAARLQLEPENCISIGDREFSDGPPAIAAGYSGAIIVPGSRNELVEVIQQLLEGCVSTTGKEK
ncbi:MAG: hypothetical protein CMI53_03950 [Parcubacteria group bacterium]|nr:hypothetical protein [Parcubacteria group bacterium]|tara:strand:+ start:2535 stop:3218 length:684 start_codon:yes stop_codon:yes gene_type:complete